MPRLPDFTDLGGAPSGNSGRIAEPNFAEATSAASRIPQIAAEQGSGLRALGKGIASVGSAAINIAQDRQDKSDRLDKAWADTNLAVSFAKLDEERNKEQNLDILRNDYPKRYSEAYEAVRGGLKNPDIASAWEAEHTKTLEGALIKTRGRVQTIERDDFLSGMTQSLTGLREQYARINDPQEHARAIKYAGDFIDSAAENGYITKEQAVVGKNSWVKDFASAWVGALPPEKQLAVLRPVETGKQTRQAFDFFVAKGYTPEQSAGIVGNLIHESGGKLDPSARAAGDGSDGSDSIGIGQWNSQRSRALKEFAAARGKPWNDFETQLEFVTHELNTSESGAAGRLKSARTVEDATAAMLGYERPKGYEGGLSTAHGGRNRLRAAKSVFGQLHEGASAPDTRLASLLPIDQASKIADHAERVIAQDEHRIEAANRENIATQEAVQRFNDLSTGGYNPFDADDKKDLNRVYGVLGGGTQALQTIADRAGVIPPEAAVSLRGGIVSNNPQKVAEAATIANDLLARNSGIFSGVTGGEEIEQAAVKFGHYVEHYGMTADEASRKLIEQNAPEFKAKIKSRLASEDVDKVIQKGITSGAFLSELSSGFAQTKIFGVAVPGFKPAVETTPAARDQALHDYADLTKESYLEHGDMALAKKQAQAQMGKIWGVSRITGQDVLMRYPPERAPAFQGIPNAADHIAEQARTAIKDELGQDVPRGKIALVPLDKGRTARSYVNGEPPPYQVMWTDDAGRVQILAPGKAFVPDVAAMRASVNEGRRAGLERARAEREISEAALPEAVYLGRGEPSPPEGAYLRNRVDR